MIETTLIYLKRNNKYLMLHRTKKENDINENKWLGIGGKLEPNETPDECIKREVKEETNIDVQIVSDKKHLSVYARKKNWILFFKQSYIPFLIVVFGVLIWVTKCCIDGDFSYNPFNTVDGFGTIFWTWKNSGEYTEGTIIKFIKLTVDNTPHLVASAWAGYICCPCWLVGGLWYFIAVTSLVGRSIKLSKRSRELFEKSLDGFNQNKASNNLNNPNNLGSEN